MSDDYAYRFQYADESAFVIYPDGRAFITFPEKDGRRRRPEQKFGKIDNRIPSLIGMAAKPRQDEIERLRAENLELATHIDGCVRVAADALKRAEIAEAVCRLTRPDVGSSPDSGK